MEDKKRLEELLKAILEGVEMLKQMPKTPFVEIQYREAMKRAEIVKQMLKK